MTTRVLDDRSDGRADVRLGTPEWRGPDEWRAAQAKLRLLLPVSIVLALWYFQWLLRVDRVGNPALYGLLVAAELFNLVQAAGFWWTCWHGRDRGPAPRWSGPRPAVDVLIPVYNEPVDVVAPTVAAASGLLGAEVTVHLLDDAGRPELEALASRSGARYLRRDGNRGAKAGNLNHALEHTDAPFVVVFDCDHVPNPRFLQATLGWMEDEGVAYVQTPQYYANAGAGRLAAAAWSQQALFFGAIARGKDALGSMFCCGTNVVFRREALDEAGGFPERSLTEDFELSVVLHEQGWRSVYVNEILAQGLGPEDMASYVSQQRRWARGCLSAVPAVIKARLPWRVRQQYLLSTMFFLSGWTFALYMTLPVVRIFFGAQPLAGATADQFLLHFAPYFCVSLMAVAVAGAGEYTFAAFALLIANYAVQVISSLLVLARRGGRWVVTAKRGSDGPQPGTVFPALVAIAGLLAAVGYALDQNLTAATLNNVAFALFHVSVLMVGSWSALAGRRTVRAREPVATPELEEVAA
ncbi:MAG TPA: glycosyltransferase family 2 protein [Acidimicrobiales bacterium]|jgi:cellulose synthase (UDP-forming)|nr:glycosyltransferase family 2 protein [Acidimicrobiales bacterium]